MESRTLVQGRRPPDAERWADSPGADALVLGRYRLKERLGAGGFGVVWRAHDELLNREVALKRIPLEPGEDSERASREALATARLAHPAIVALYEACPSKDAYYLISELIDGDTLAHLIAARALSDGQVLQIGIALCGALSHAHARGVIHRDVKPHNVLVPDTRAAVLRSGEKFAVEAKLTDFGGARLSGEDVVTRTGDVLGTFAYMAPEQSEGREVGEAADLYSLALVLYEALCGFNPLRGSSPAETVRRIGRPIEPLERARRGLPRVLTRAIDRCLLAAPSARGTIEELQGALEAALGDAPDSRHEPLPSADPRSGRSAEHVVYGSPVQRPDPAPRPGRLWIPRGLLLGCALAACAWQALAGDPGTALLLLAAFLPLPFLPLDRRSAGGSGAWLSAALAPALGLVGLAGAFPAIAGQAGHWRTRASLGALGYWWLVLSEPLLARTLWLGPSSPTPARAEWEGSLQSAATHVVGPILNLGVLLGAALWALAAVLLPLLVRGRSAALDVVAATVWSAALAAAAPLLDSGLATATAHVSPRGAVLGAVFGGALAVAARALRGPV